MKSLIKALGVVLALVTSIEAQEYNSTLPELNNYQWAFKLQAGARASFYNVELPLLVYQSAADERLRDLSVYNAANQAVPRVIEPAVTNVEELETRNALPYAALFLNQEPDADRVRMMFEQMGGETRIKVESDKAANDEKIQPPLSGYIVDTRGLDGDIDALELEWPQPISGFVGRVTVSGSNDLEQWQLVGGAALADLQEADTQILQSRVSIADNEYDFLRLQWVSLPDNWRLTQLTAVQVSRAPQRERQKLSLASNGNDDEDGGLMFDAGGAVPVDRLSLGLPADNTVVTASIYRWIARNESWSRVYRGAFYQLSRDDTPISNKPVPIDTTRSARWKVVIEKGQPDTRVTLELGWQPDTVLFVAQGDAPYTLATGRPQAASEFFPEDHLLGDVSLGGIATDNGPVAAATVGDRYKLAGIEREVPKKPIDWQTILLWVGLLIAVLFVVSMAVRVTRALSDDNLAE
ncbi:MAG: DUF3999 domain-containing protein [Gammaproteobacteria bacterium]|nr:DUF3999 domain-containing protein [Gammaproteobacteria bacterium]